jgi:hypothetical protein
MEAFLPDSIKTALLGVIAAVIVLGWLARRLPHVAWLQAFRFAQVQASEDEKERRRRSANRLAAGEMVLAGVLLPMGYAALTVMMFNDFEPLMAAAVAAGSVLCIAAGIWVYVRNP